MAKYWIKAADRLGNMEIAVEAGNEKTALFRAGMALIIAAENSVDTTVPIDTVASPDWDSSAVISGMPEVLDVRIES